MYLSRTDTADRLHIHPTTLDRWARTGRITRLRVPGSRAALYNEEQVNALAQADHAHLKVVNEFEAVHWRRDELARIIHLLIASNPGSAHTAITAVRGAREG